MTFAARRAQFLEDIRDSQTPSARLMAVSKMQPAESIKDALAAGQRLFGENRVQDAEDRWTEYKRTIPDLDLHLIGPLQTNKADKAVALFDMIHSLDREKLAQILSQEMQKQQKKLPCLIQVNTGEETQKAGILPCDLPDFLEFCRKECRLDIQGLMCIPPAQDPPALHFAFLKKLAKAHALSQLSMGMSADYTKALRLGTTYIRIGTALFGQRI
ncbi:MAG: YggS family pyridoxal phosphate-dependent enzyme [Rhodospirillales bacterium]|nr:YggS family pyridoxal phosphate-dependent enzyme [Rhodospirillales bacterium]MCB9964519.1 YggS family pyridoxal phosphate-dependent enzyme [Rhodospirillales bacterium]MCB9973792.1 YggS family pyridoxal phosphate-dependent enzyme [Rhodospirillales bacterium]MCB9980324.1 YggS family pyridoxal phosphate-dependent enzyme [Rhodospirillales bacterium]